MQLVKNQKGLNDHVSVVKGIAILAMVLNHTGLELPAPWGHMTSMLRMPTFLIASGYCFKDIYLEQRWRFVGRRLKSLYKPYVKWSLIFVLLHNLFIDIHFLPASAPVYSCSDMLAQIPHTLLMRTPEQLLGGYWFITELFFAAMIFIACSSWIRKRPLLWVAIFVLVAIVMQVLGWHARVRPTSFLAAAYYTLGYWARGRRLSHHWAVIAGLLILLYVGGKYVPGHINDIKPATEPLNFLLVMAGAWMVAAVAHHIVQHAHWLTRALAYVGTHTLIILTLHFVAMRALSWCIVQAMGWPVERVAENPTLHHCPWALPLYFVVAVAVPLLYDWPMKPLRQRAEAAIGRFFTRLVRRYFP